MTAGLALSASRSAPVIFQSISETDLRATAPAAARKADWTPSTRAIYSNGYNDDIVRSLPDEDRDPGPHHLRGRGRRRRISLGFVDSTGNPATIRLSLNQVGALAMTLPGLIDKALQTRFGDQSLRYAYPLASWLVEQSSDPAQTMVTLRTVDGFSVCFSIPRQQQSELGAALVAQTRPGVTLRPH